MQLYHIYSHSTSMETVTAQAKEVRSGIFGTWNITSYASMRRSAGVGLVTSDWRGQAPWSCFQSDLHLVQHHETAQLQFAKANAYTSKHEQGQGELSTGVSGKRGGAFNS
eukprot:scaffold129059_cov22-Tisochrysis_lutea.AAC.1